MYHEFPPGAAVQDLVLNYWSLSVFDSPDSLGEYLVIPDGCLRISMEVIENTVVSMPLSGPRRDSMKISLRSGVQYWGIRFRPEMGASFLGRPAVMLRGQTGHAHHWLGAEPIRLLSSALLEAINEFRPSTDTASAHKTVALALDRWLFDSADTTLPPEACVRSAVQAIVATGGSSPISKIAELADVSVRHLQRCFKEAVGLSPKEYSMIRRSWHEISEHDESLSRYLSDDVNRLLMGMPDRLFKKLKNENVIPSKKAD